MFYPQANLYSQFGINPTFNPGFQLGLNPQGLSPQQFNPQQSFIAQQGYGAPGYFNAPVASLNGAQGTQGLHTLQQLLANTLVPQQLSPQQFAVTSGFNGIGNGASVAGWPQPQAQFGQHPQHQLLLQLAQYHYLVAQQLGQLAAQQSAQQAGNPLGGQFIPGQQSAPFVPAFTMH
jgi:hypothetical protein